MVQSCWLDVVSTYPHAYLRRMIETAANAHDRLCCDHPTQRLWGKLLSRRLIADWHLHTNHTAKQTGQPNWSAGPGPDSPSRGLSPAEVCLASTPRYISPEINKCAVMGSERCKSCGCGAAAWLRSNGDRGIEVKTLTLEKSDTIWTSLGLPEEGGACGSSGRHAS